MTALPENNFKALLVAAMLLFFTTTIKAQKTFDPLHTKAITEAILNYVEGVYEMDTARIYKSVHPQMAKRGFAYNKNNSNWSPKLEMNFLQLVDLTKNWNKDGSKANKQSVRHVEIFDVQDKTASAKVTAAWGTDYFHLAYMDGKWMIVNVLWQTPPVK
jgi:hypothetical protein